MKAGGTLRDEVVSRFLADIGVRLDEQDGCPVLFVPAKAKSIWFDDEGIVRLRDEKGRTIAAIITGAKP